MKNIVLVIGHNSSRKGALNYLGEYEYDFNSRIAQKVKEKLDGRIDILYKDSKYETFLGSLRPYLAIELHFNFFGGNASGCEALNIDSDIEQELKAFLYLLSTKFNLRNRGIKTLEETSRGYKNLSLLGEYCTKSFILEPCFQSDKAIFKNEDDYALLIAEFLEDYLPTQLKPIKQEESLWRKLFQFLSELLRL